jgi:putative phosphoribosyl transferase
MQADTHSSGEAGRSLADQLAALSLHEPVIVVFSPQAVGLAFEAARRLGCELDLLLVGYILAPGHPDQVIGSVLDLTVPQVTIDEDLAREFHVPPGYLNTERQHQIAELERLHFMYLGNDDPARHDHAGKDVVLLDDGTDEDVLQAVTKRFKDAGALSVHVVNTRSIEGPPIDDRTIAHLLKEARRLHKLLH